MGSDLNNIIKTQSLTDEHVQLLIYQVLRGLKVRTTCVYVRTCVCMYYVTGKDQLLLLSCVICSAVGFTTYVCMLCVLSVYQYCTAGSIG